MSSALFLMARSSRRLALALLVPVLLLTSWHGVAAADPASDEGDETTDGESLDDAIGSIATSEFGDDIELSIEVVSGPVLNEADGTYSVTYELIVTSDDAIEPTRLLGFTTTTDSPATDDDDGSAGTGTRSEAADSETDGEAVEVLSATASATSNPQLDVTKRLVQTPVPDADGTFEVLFEVVAANSGDETLTRLQIYDDLADVFGPEAEIAVTGIAAAGGLTANQDYDGVDVIELLTGTGSLDEGETGAVTVSADIKPLELGTYSSNVDATGESASGKSSMVSIGDAAAIVLEANQAIEVELLLAGDPTETSPGVFEGEFQITVTNPGPFKVSDLQIHESFAPDDGTKLSIESVTTGDSEIELDPWFDGRENADHLRAGGDLAVGESRELVVTVATNVKILNDLRQQVIASAEDPFGTRVAGGTLAALMVSPTSAVAATPTPRPTPTPTPKPSAGAGQNGSTDDRVTTPRADAPEKRAGEQAPRALEAANEVLGAAVEKSEVSEAAIEAAEPNVEEVAEPNVEEADEVAAPFRPPIDVQQPANTAFLLVVAFAVIGLAFGSTMVIVNIRNSRRAAIVDEWLTGG